MNSAANGRQRAVFQILSCRALQRKDRDAWRPAAYAPSALGAPDVVILVQEVEDGMPLVQFAKAIVLLRRQEAVRYLLLWRKAILKEREHSLPVGLSTPSPLVFGKDGRRTPSAACLGKTLRRGGPSLLRTEGNGRKPRVRLHREQVKQEHSQPAAQTQPAGGGRSQHPRNALSAQFLPCLFFVAKGNRSTFLKGIAQGQVAAAHRRTEVGSAG